MRGRSLVVAAGRRRTRVAGVGVVAVGRGGPRHVTHFWEGRGGDIKNSLEAPSERAVLVLIV